MPHRLRKIRKTRGSRTQGYGRVGQHRKSGSKGERKPGRHKGGWSFVQRYYPDYFKKKGFKSTKNMKEFNIINVDNLQEIGEKLSKNRKKPRRLNINLFKMGYDKVLGRGAVTLPLTIRVSSCSKIAQMKIEAAGGEVLKEK